jgi:hypothetical protein
MGSPLFETNLLTDLEPGIPGGETPPSTAGETPAATEARRAGRTVAHGVSHGYGVALDFEPRRGDQNRPRWGWYWGERRMFCPPLVL